MRCAPACKPCLERLVRKAATLASDGDENLQRRVLPNALGVLRETFRAGETVPTRLATRCLDRLRKDSGNPDPFAPVKAAELQAARRALSLLEPRFGDSLSERLLLSVLGNRLDFFREVEEVEKEWQAQRPRFARNGSREFAARVSQAQHLVFLTDNVGEVLFDLPLIRHLIDNGTAVSVAVKGRPSQNDLTRDDAARWQLPLPNLVDTGTAAVGCELARVGEAFRRAWDRADVILAKGMANFETLTEYPEVLAEKPVYFLLCAKCRPVAEAWGVEVGASLFASAASRQRPRSR